MYNLIESTYVLFESTNDDRTLAVRFRNHHYMINITIVQKLNASLLWSTEKV